VAFSLFERGAVWNFSGVRIFSPYWFGFLKGYVNMTNPELSASPTPFLTNIQIGVSLAFALRRGFSALPDPLPGVIPFNHKFSRAWPILVAFSASTPILSVLVALALATHFSSSSTL